MGVGRPPKHVPIFGDNTLHEMRRLAFQGMESRDAFETMVREGKLPAGTRLDTFRHAGSREGIQWGKPGEGKIMCSFLLSPPDAHELLQAAIVRGTTRNLLAQKLITTIIKDRMFNAILDDENDPQRPNNT